MTWRRLAVDNAAAGLLNVGIYAWCATEPISIIGMALASVSATLSFITAGWVLYLGAVRGEP